MALLRAGGVGSAVALLLISIAAAPLSGWWVANVITNFRLQLVAAGLIVLVLGLVLRMPHMALMGALSVLVNGVVVLDRLRPATAATRAPVTAPGLRIMSLNLLYKNRDAEALSRQIEQVRPDVLLFQEVGAFWTVALRRLRVRFPHGLGLPRVDSSAEGHGALVLSRHPILEVDQRTLGGSSIRLAAARIAVGHDTLWVASVHTVKPNGPTGLKVQRSQLEQVAAWVNARDGPVLLGGDLNATAYAPQMGRLLATTGLTLDQQASPSQAIAGTFPAALPVLGLKLDHILVRGLAIRRALTLPPAGSDHRSVVADVALPGR